MTSDYRTGIGFDFHRLVEGRELILGGVRIPHPKGLLGHSDADALLHAVCDALLGALSLGDIGGLFPDSDPRYKGVSSLELLHDCCKRVHRQGYRIVNVDAVVLAEAPRIAPYRNQMIANISRAAVETPEAVSVKATTTEACGAVGRGEGIGAMATVLLQAIPRSRDGGA
jgi:2-C-methyl-D-erythritol 2,4-cyclodiphosphate synthase